MRPNRLHDEDERSDGQLGLKPRKVALGALVFFAVGAGLVLGFLWLAGWP